MKTIRRRGKKRGGREGGKEEWFRGEGRGGRGED
jgi:hypothetical protein